MYLEISESYQASIFQSVRPNSMHLKNVGDKEIQIISNFKSSFSQLEQVIPQYFRKVI